MTPEPVLRCVVSGGARPPRARRRSRVDGHLHDRGCDARGEGLELGVQAGERPRGGAGLARRGAGPAPDAVVARAAQRGPGAASGSKASCGDAASGPPSARPRRRRGRGGRSRPRACPSLRRRRCPRRLPGRASPQLVALRPQEGEGVGREADPLVADPVGQPLVVEARRVDRLLDVHAEVDHVQDASAARC